MNTMYHYWLNTVEGIGLIKTTGIIRYFGSIENAWEANSSEFYNIKGLKAELAGKIIERRNEKKLLNEINIINSKGIDIITVDSEKYPAKLKEIYDPPFILYVIGNLEIREKNIAVVGARKCTLYGRAVSRNISKLLSEYNIGIISGMARGIDAEAHRGAMDGNGFTCAVLGCGCDIAYPPENKKLMLEIEKKGAVVSEYPPGTQPISYNFPARNRIISGLSDGVLIIEAGEKSGALITANFALEQGRDVFAVPGSILSNMSKGTNLLIKDGAKPVTDIGDILNELGIDVEIMNEKLNMNGLTSREKVIMEVICDSPIYLDDLLKKVSLKIGEINSILTSLEMKGLIRILPGKYIVRII